MAQACQVPELVRPQEMVGEVGPVVALGILMQSGVNDNHRTKFGWRIRAPLKRQSSGQVRPAEVDLLDDLDVKIASHIGIRAMDRGDVVLVHDFRRIG
jgi:hypothetical protein